MTPDDLKERTKEFGLRVVRLSQALPRNRVAQVIGDQLLRCGTSVGANYRAACRSRSRAEFIAKMGLVEEEADEAGYWIEMLIATKTVRPNLLTPLLEEAGALCAIAASSKITARRNRSFLKHNDSTIANRKSVIDNRQSHVTARPSK